MKLQFILVACALFAASASANAYTVTLEESGSNVVATGSGDINLTGLSFEQSAAVIPGLVPDKAAIITSLDFASIDNYTAPTGPTSFGSGNGVGEIPNSASGDAVGYCGSCGVLSVPEGYVSGNPLSDTMTFDTATFASLGVTRGTYVWTWGSAADQSFTLEIGATPLPAALPLFASGLGALGLFGWRRKRHARGGTEQQVA